MLTQDILQRAIGVHQQVYTLIDAIRHARRTHGRLRFETVHQAMNEFDAAEGWLERNRSDLPVEAWPDGSDSDAFVQVLVSFGLTSNDRSVAPATARVRCRCRWCRELVWRLGERGKVTPRDAKSAESLIRMSLRDLADDRERVPYPLAMGDIDTLIQQCGDLADDLTWFTYGAELVRRCEFRANRQRYAGNGHCLLVLWRRIAMEKDGRVRKGFIVDADRILAAEERVAKAMSRMAERMLTA